MQDNYYTNILFLFFTLLAMYWPTRLTLISSFVPGTIANWQWMRPSSDDTLRFGTPESVGLLSAPLREMEINVTNYQKPANYGGFSNDEIYPIEPSSAVIGWFVSDSMSFAVPC
jgi:hypothetical protein